MYDPNTNIAIEYNGIQHYEYPNPFHTSKKEFDYQVYKDKLKEELSDKNGIYLIQIPYYIDYKNPGVSKEYRREKLKEYLLPKFIAILESH